MVHNTPEEDPHPGPNEELRKREADFRSLIAQASDGIFLSGPTGEMFDVNTYGCALTGYKHEELMRLSFHDLFFAEDLEKQPLRFEEILHGLSVLTERRIRKKDGSSVEVETHTNMLSDGRILSIMRNITERKRMENSLRESESRFRMIVEHIPIAIACYNSKRESVFANQKFIELAGYTVAETPTVDEFNARVYPDPAYRQWIKETWTATDTARFEVEMRHKNGETRNVEVARASWEDQTYVIAHDITERKKLEKRLEQQQRLKQQQITEAVLFAQESERSEIGQELHDNINQILVASKMFLDSGLYPDPPDRELLNVSLENITLAIEEIRKLSKTLITPWLREIGLKDSIRMLADNFLLANKMNIELNIDRFDENIVNKEQKIAIYRIIQEQLTNIIKYAGASTINISLENQQQQIILSVSDNGKGFDPSISRKGIGMTNIMSRAEIYNGYAQFKSAPGKGCRLEVVLYVPGPSVLA